ncbi:hypothetical protein [Actinokineospora bangkokensis]|uniref:Uncharacterized protein n=1 Tax=Actinokineospora bangkokensis TaxID=1193682 RepID=A0A1Q9LTU3_9PSEU|nr:hypothetical protein [Actinokineospora bangkokensis]OLR95467.1 hypothetical protein BJP25_06935 [Actinokineospora bangkokensis]
MDRRPPRPGTAGPTWVLAPAARDTDRVTAALRASAEPGPHPGRPTPVRDGLPQLLRSLRAALRPLPAPPPVPVLGQRRRRAPARVPSLGRPPAGGREAA